MKNIIFVLCGNCRTFINCFDSIHTHIISKMFSQDINIYLYLYLKLSDPGPKDQYLGNFNYNDVDYTTILDKINKIKEEYSSLNIDYKLLPTDEITDNELLSQVKNRHLYTGFYSDDKKLLRGLHCHYNFEKCGNYILEKEQTIKCKFDYIIYIRPDLFFFKSCDNIKMYNKNLITLGTGPNSNNYDHIAIIPRFYLNAFFFDRMYTYRNNETKYFNIAEDVYSHTIEYEIKSIGDYYIKRN